MTSGLKLLERARPLDSDELRALAGPGGTSVSDSLTRPALVTALLSAFTEADRSLVADLTRFEIEVVRQNPSRGCGDVLLACCWMLFRIGRVEDTALIWEVKELNFDTFAYIDSVFLVPAGVEATATFARRNGLKELADYVGQDWLHDPVDGVASWRAGEFFSARPSPNQPVEVLAAWIAS